MAASDYDDDELVKRLMDALESLGEEGGVLAQLCLEAERRRIARVYVAGSQVILDKLIVLVNSWSTISAHVGPEGASLPEGVTAFMQKLYNQTKEAMEAFLVLQEEVNGGHGAVGAEVKRGVVSALVN